MTIAHVVFLDLRTFANSPQLNQGISRVGFVLRLYDLVVIGSVNQSEVHHLRVWQEVQRDEIGARLFQRRIVFLEERLWTPLQVRCDLSGRVPDDFMEI